MVAYVQPVKINTPRLDYEHKAKGTLKVDGLPFNGVVILLSPPLGYIRSGTISNGQFSFIGVPPKWQNRSLVIAISVDNQLFSQKVEVNNAVTYDLAISTTGGGGEPVGDPATIAGKVERINDNVAEAMVSQLVAIENKPDGSWAVVGDTLSEGETGAYTLDVLTEGGDTFVLAIDDYGSVFTSNEVVIEGDIVHPTVPNGQVYRVEVGGTLPATEPDWWEAGSSSVQIIGNVSLRAMPFYRPLVHGFIKPELKP